MCVILIHIPIVEYLLLYFECAAYKIYNDDTFKAHTFI